MSIAMGLEPLGGRGQECPVASDASKVDAFSFGLMAVFFECAVAMV